MELVDAKISFQPERGGIAVQMTGTFDTGEVVAFTIRLPKSNPTLIDLQRAALARARTLLDEADRAWSTSPS